MLMFLPAPITGSIMFLLVAANLVLWAFPVYTLVLIKLFTWGRGRVLLSRWTATTAQEWASWNVWLLDNMLDIHWDIRGADTLSMEGKYLTISNHQNWNDIPMLMKAFDKKAPFFKFFLKQELIWVPILGLAWWGLDFPFMKRYTKEQIERDPSLKGKDVETTKKACEKFRHQPVLVVNYVEGTRFTPEKHDRQQSPYTHLLKPKAGGFAFALNALGDVLDCVLNVTVVYPDGDTSFWELLCGKLKHVILDIEKLPIPEEFLAGDYSDDPVFREQFQNWVTQLWLEKDAKIDQILSDTGPAT